MGLAGRKVKQRIPNDPRNLSWADDANKFGAAYLQKLGWSSGTGLGTTGEGRTTHIKVNQKLDMLGIGAAHQKDPNGLAWKQNRDFENLLKRLNAGGGDAEDEPGTKVDGFARATGEKDEAMTESKKRKRGSEDGDDDAKSESGDSPVEESKEERKKRKKEEKARRKEEKERKKEEKKAEGIAKEENVVEIPSETSVEPPKPRPVVGRPVRAHRARFMASKNIASKSSSAIDEILGISRSGSATPYPSVPDTPTLTDPSSSASPAEALKMQELTTSSKSVMDYFKEKLLAKSNAASSSSSLASSPLASTSASTSREEYDDYDDRPRGLGAGLGAGMGGGLGFARSSTGGIGASRLRSEVTFEVEEREEPVRGGLGSTFASRMSAMFSAAKETAAPDETVSESVEVEVVQETAVEEHEERKEKKSKKSKEGREKKDKGKKRAEAVETDEDADEQVKKDKKSKKRKERAADVTEEVAEEVRKSKRKTSKDESADASPDADGETASKPAKGKKEKKSKKEKERGTEAEAEVVGEADGEKKKKKSKKHKSSDS